MGTQISLTVPDALLAYARKRASARGHRSVQEFLLELVRDEYMLQHKDEYFRIQKEMRADKGVSKMSPAEYRKWAGLR